MTEVIQQGTKECLGNGMDTVVVMCLAIVKKKAYDAAGVQKIEPAVVLGANDVVIAKLPPVLFVGPSSQVQETIMKRLLGEFEKYENKKE